MRIVDKLFASAPHQNFTLVNNYLCLFNSPAREEVKFLPLSLSYVKEAYHASFVFGIQSREYAEVVEKIIHSRVPEWKKVNYPWMFIRALERWVMGLRGYTGLRILCGFDSFMDVYREFLDSFEYFGLRTPCDQEPSEVELRECHARMVKALRPYVMASIRAKKRILPVRARRLASLGQPL